MQSIVSVTCGDGYGDPIEREPALVAVNVSEDWISREWATQVYGVVITGDSAVERSASQAARCTASASRRRHP